MSVEDLGKMEATTNGARFWAVDLHVHTPASKDVDLEVYGAEEPVQIVQAAIDAGLDAIAVTDHNTADWCERMADAAEGTELIVLPGVEVSTREGHLLAIFEAGTAIDVVNDLLTRLDIDTSKRGEMDAFSSKGFEEAALEVVRSGGIAIPAHIDKEKGLLKLTIPIHMNSLLTSENIAGFDIVDRSQIPAVKRKVGDSPQLAFIRSSDCGVAGSPGHQLAGIGQRRTWIKATRPDLVGIKHALDDPDLRIRLDAPEPVSHPYIKSVKFDGGFLDGTNLHFSPELNCLLGGTGTGKSLVLEAIRYALDQQADPSFFPAIRKEVDDRLAGALRENGTVQLTISGQFGERLVTRSLTNGPPSVPVVSRWYEGEYVQTPETPGDLLTFHAFSQGEALEFARAQVGRMSLVDSSLDLSSFDARESELCEKLSKNGQQFVNQRHQINQLEKDTAGYDKVKGELDSLATRFDPGLVEEQQRWQAEEAGLTEILRSVKQLAVVKTMGERLEIAGVVEQNKDLISRASKVLTGLTADLSKLEEDATGVLMKSQAELLQIEAEWRDRFNEFSRRLNEKFTELGDGATLTSLRMNLETLQRRVETLRVAKDRLEQVETPKLLQLIDEREKLVQELGGVRKEKRKVRRKKIDVLNRRTKGAVKLDLPLGADISEFRRALEKLRTGSRVNDDFLDAVSTKIHPHTFVREMLYGDTDSLENAAEGIGLNPLRSYRDNVIEKSLEVEFLEIQHCSMPDRLSVKFLKPENGEYTPIEQLAHGQKCTAILVTLLADGDAPVVVDQPEDALHAPWIEEYLVERLRGLRGNRQCIFATRSPGIVVGADAEQIVTLQASAETGTVEATGSLERHDLNKLALQHLEGGPIAFQRRSRKLKPSIGI